MTDQENDPTVIVEQTDDIPKPDDPEEYVAGVMQQREEDEERDHDAENIRRARGGLPSLEDEEKEQEEARKNAEADAKKREAEEKKGDEKKPEQK